MKYGYARVSTVGQQTHGNSLEAQGEQLCAAGAEKIYSDAITGAIMNREQLDKLLNQLKAGDTLIVTKLDRLARSLTQGAELIDSLIDLGITINILNLGILDNQPSSRLIRNVFLSFAEFERDMIRERTTEGRAVAKTKPGYREGRRPKYSRKQIDHALKLLQDHSYNQVAEMTGISKSTLIRSKQKQMANKTESK